MDSIYVYSNQYKSIPFVRMLWHGHIIIFDLMSQRKKDTSTVATHGGEMDGGTTGGITRRYKPGYCLPFLNQRYM